MQLLGILYIFIVDPWAPPTDQPQPPIEQFRPAQIPEELRTFLKSGEDGQGISKWESCNSISLLLHMLFQEHKDTRALRRLDILKVLTADVKMKLNRNPSTADK